MTFPEPLISWQDEPLTGSFLCPFCGYVERAGVDRKRMWEDWPEARVRTLIREHLTDGYVFHLRHCAAREAKEEETE